MIEGGLGTVDSSMVCFVSFRGGIGPVGEKRLESRTLDSLTPAEPLWGGIDPAQKRGAFRKRAPPDRLSKYITHIYIYVYTYMYVCIYIYIHI